MPAPERTSSVARSVLPTVYGRPRGNEIRLDVGDTYQWPIEDLCRNQAQCSHYTSPSGYPPLKERLIYKLREWPFAIPVNEENILITAGATAALQIAIRTIADPGTSIMVASPYWPLVRGSCKMGHVTPVEIPTYDDPLESLNRFEDGVTGLTRAIYISSPSNPTGVVLDHSFFEGLIDIADRYGLYLISDEVYAHLIYEGEHYSPARDYPYTITLCSFSKAYGMAGYRVGWMTGPEHVISHAIGLAVHTYYSVPTISQHAAVVACNRGYTWLDTQHSTARVTGRQAAEILGLPYPGGSTFLWVPTGDIPAMQARDKLQDRGVLVVPGLSFGSYPNHIRVCYTSENPRRVLDGVSIIKEVLHG